MLRSVYLNNLGRSTCSLLQARFASGGGPVMPETPIKPGKYKDLSTDEILRIKKNHISPAIFTYQKNPVHLHKGYKQWVWDAEGKRYLDLIAGIVTVGVGHCHPKINEVATEQMNKFWHTTSVYLTSSMHEYAKKLTDKLPGNLKVCYFTNSGSEANDLAMLMARLYTGSYELVALRGAYHGTSPSTMGLTALGSWKFNIPSNLGIHHSVNPDPYRGPWGGLHCRDSPVQTTRNCNCAAGTCEANDKYIDQIQDLLNHVVPKRKLAGFIAESIQGAGGTVQFTKGYLKKVYELVRERGGVCIADEVQTGFGRTGEHFWGFQMHDVVPDMVTMAKSIANGFPMAAVVTTPEIAQVMTQALHFNTYGGNPIGCKVASTVLDIIEEEKLQENSRVVGTYLLENLAKLRDEFEFVGDVRGKGLMTGMELVKNKETKQPMPAEDFMNIWEDVKNQGVLVGKGGVHGNVFRIKPPMCITKPDVDFCVEVFRSAFKKYAK